MHATSTYYVRHHPMAQPVRTSQGWLLACHGACNAEQLHLLVDLGRTDELPEWELMPDGLSRTLLMLDSRRLLRLHFDLRNATLCILKAQGLDCAIRAASEGAHYAITLHCSTRPL